MATESLLKIGMRVILSDGLKGYIVGVGDLTMVNPYRVVFDNGAFGWMGVNDIQPLVPPALYVGARVKSLILWRGEYGTEGTITYIDQKSPLYRYSVTSSIGAKAYFKEDELELLDTDALKLSRLTNAVRAIYYSARWSPDRPLENEAAMWTELRDAAGFEPGQSPKPYIGEWQIGNLVRVKHNDKRHGSLWNGCIGEVIHILPDRTRTICVDFHDVRKPLAQERNYVRYRPTDLEPYKGVVDWIGTKGGVPNPKSINFDPEVSTIDIGRWEKYGDTDPWVSPIEWSAFAAYLKSHDLLTAEIIPINISREVADSIFGSPGDRPLVAKFKRGDAVEVINPRSAWQGHKGTVERFDSDHGGYVVKIVRNAGIYFMTYAAEDLIADEPIIFPCESETAEEYEREIMVARYRI